MARLQAETNVLEAIGVDGAEEAVYRALLRMPAATVADLSRQVGASATAVRERLSNLEKKGLVNRTTGTSNRFVPTPPEAAIEVLVLDGQRELERARLAAKDLESTYRAARSTPPGPLDIVEVVLGPEAIQQRFGQLVQSARERLRVFDRPPYASDPLAPNKLELELLEREVSCMALYTTDALSIPGRLEHLRGVAEAGEQARTIPDLPMKLFIADESVAFIPLSLDEPGTAGGLVVQDSPVLEALVTLFETLWERAVPIDFSAGYGAEAAADNQRPAAEDERLVTLLLAGLKDDAIARQLGVSRRTVLRRVADLMDALGAQTRFQCGWLAGQRGLGA